MNLIQKITQLDHPGVLRDFKWPTDLAEFGRFNLIYGWNGSGKTTLSRLFRHLEQGSVPSTGQVVFCIRGNDVASDTFPEIGIQVRVFNRDFVNESVFPIGGGDVPPIFVVGKESVEKQKEVNRLNKAKSEEEIRLDQAKKASQQAKDEIERYCVNRAKIIKDILRTSGTSRYNYYDKTMYDNRMQDISWDDGESCKLDETTREALLLQHRATIKPKVSEVQYRLPIMEDLHNQVATLRSTTVTTSVIQALENDSELGEWTRQGLIIHSGRESQICLFCKKPLSSGRLAELESHFSTEYEQFLQHLDKLLGQLKASMNTADALRLPSPAEFYEDISQDYQSAKESLEEALERAHAFMSDLVQCLEEKKRKPFTSLQLDMKIPEIDGDVVDRLNEIIQRHNKACDDFQTRTTKARDRLADGMIAEGLDHYWDLQVAELHATNAIDPIQKKIDLFSREITRLEQEIVEHRRPAEELNADLHKYLSHDELRLEVKDTGYALMRRDGPADSLSEGEKTALALLYFLKSLGDQRFNFNKGVVVLDDPVSSLDSNALYLAFGYIKERTKNAGQLFLLTHNFTFFRQVKNWFHHLPGQNKKDINKRPARFYMLDRVTDAAPRRTTIRPLDPLLEQYESEYHYLFSYVYREACATRTHLEQAYAIPNIARRLLEMFLAFRRPQIAGDLWRKLEDIEFDIAKKVRILRFVHTYSHGDAIVEPEHEPSVLGEARSILADLMEFIKSQDSEHYQAMVDAVQHGNEARDSEEPP